MKFYKFTFILLTFLLISNSIFAQTLNKNKSPQSSSISALQNAKSSSAYAELLLRKTELEADVESFLVSYTEEYPKLKESRYEIALLNKDIGRILAEKDVSKLTLALGKLMVRKNGLATDLWALQGKFGKEHPEVKRMERKVEIFQNAIKEILP